MAEQGVTRAAVWARVSTHDQHTANQLDALRAVTAQRGLEIVREFVTEDSAWSRGNGKGSEFDAQRDQLAAGALRRDYSVVLVWAVDRLSRRGYRDLDAFLQRLARCDCEVWSVQEPWLTNLGPFGEIVLHMLAWMAQMESERRSERIKAGLARRRREGKPVGGRKAGAKDKAKRSTEGYSLAWTPERRAELGERNRQRAVNRPDPPGVPGS